MADVVWVHDEMLTAHRPEPGAPAVFVFDDAWIAAERLSLKRIVFLYECLLELPGVEILRGDVVACVRSFAAAHEADRIVSVESPTPRIRRQGDALAVCWRPAEPLVDIDEPIDLRRFSTYWRKAQGSLLRD